MASTGRPAPAVAMYQPSKMAKRPMRAVATSGKALAAAKPT